MSEWIYGRNPVFEVLRAGRRKVFRLWIAQGVQVRRFADILRLSRENQLNTEYIPRANLDGIAQGHQGVALETSGYPYGVVEDAFAAATRLNEPPLLLILDALQDPQNLGTLLRTAEATGVHGVVLPLRQTVTVTPAVVNASSGASEHLLIAQSNLTHAIKMLKKRDVWVVGLEDVPEALYPDQVHLEGPLALVVGNEGSGLRRLVRESCDLLMRLPMRGKLDSLNASVAGSVALYLAWQRRNYAR